MAPPQTTHVPPAPVPVSLQDLVHRAKDLIAGKPRTLLGITGAPGAGKSTLCVALLAELGEVATLVGMDGFHLANQELHRLGRVSRKGAPDTFDVDGYTALLSRLRTQHGTRPIYAPVFDRGIEESIGSAAPVHPQTPLVITEGNYLLLEDPAWAPVRGHLDEVWFLDVDPVERERRLISRRQSFGHSLAESEAWVNEVDTKNAELIDPTRRRADFVFHVQADAG